MMDLRRWKALGLVAAVLVHAVLLFSNRTWNYWDGGVIDYAITEGKFSGLRAFFFDSNWHLEYWVLRLEAAAAAVVGVHFRYVEYTIVLGCIALSSSAVLRLYRVYFGERAGAAFAALVLAASPIWALGLSSVMVPELLFFTGGLAGAALLLSVRSTPAQLAGIAAVIFGFQLNSVATMTLAIALAALAFRRDLRWPALGLAALSVLGCAAILVIQRVSPPVGQFANYNLIVLSGSRIGPSVKSLLSFIGPFACIVGCHRLLARRSSQPAFLRQGPGVWLLSALIAATPYIAITVFPRVADLPIWYVRHTVVVIPFLVLAVVQFMPIGEQAGRARDFLTALRADEASYSGRWNTWLGPALWLFAAVLAAAPYIALARFAGLIDMRDWFMRNSIVVFPFLAFATGQLTSVVSRRWRPALCMLLLLPLVGITAARYASLAKRRGEEHALVATLRPKRPEDRGSIVPDLHTKTAWAYRQNERSWLGYRAWGTTAYYPCVNESYDDCVEDTRSYIFTSADRSLRLMYLTDGFHNVP